MRRKVKRAKNRSGKFPCEICKNPNFLVEHHINGRDIPNANHPSNLVSICSNCHMLIHSGKIIIEKWVVTSEGRILFWHPVEESSFTGEDSSPHIIP
jgi:hypothetical protein